MTNQEKENPDMVAELYLKPFKKISADGPLIDEGKCLAALKPGQPKNDRVLALLRLLAHSRAERCSTGGKFTQAAATKLLCQFETQLGTDLEGEAGMQLTGEGAFCEQVGDFEGAVWLYQGALRFKIEDSKFIYFRYNNLGFSLNYLGRFQEAEDYLQKALEHEPRAYNAWKNAGVTMEHLGKPGLAANAYMNAINKSGGEARCIKHFMRLLDRHPELKEDEQVAGYLDSLKKHGKI